MKHFEDDWGKGRGVLLSVGTANLALSSAPKAQKPPQAVLKVASQARGHRVHGVLDYIGRADDEKQADLEIETEDGETIKGKEDISALYDEWKPSFERAKPGSQRPPRHATHMIFSADCKHTKENANKVRDAAREMLSEQLGDAGYRYGWVLHNDSGHLHVHVVVNNYHREKGPKLRTNKPELKQWRQQFAEKLSERGLVHQATRQLDNPEHWKALAQSPNKHKEGHHTRMMHRLNPEPGHFAQACNMDRTVNDLKKAIGADLSMPVAEKQVHRHQLHQIKHDLRALPVEHAQKRADATLQDLGKNDKYAKTIDKLRHPSAKVIPMRQAHRARGRNLGIMAKKQRQKIDKAIQEVKKSQLSSGEKKPLIAQFRAFQRTVQNREIER